MVAFIRDFNHVEVDLGRLVLELLQLLGVRFGHDPFESAEVLPCLEVYPSAVGRQVEDSLS